MGRTKKGGRVAAAVNPSLVTPLSGLATAEASALA